MGTVVCPFNSNNEIEFSLSGWKINIVNSIRLDMKMCCFALKSGIQIVCKNIPICTQTHTYTQSYSVSGRSGKKNKNCILKTQHKRRESTLQTYLHNSICTVNVSRVYNRLLSWDTHGVSIYILKWPQAIAWKNRRLVMFTHGIAHKNSNKI